MTCAKYWIFVVVAIMAENFNMGSVQAQLPSAMDDLMKQVLGTLNGSGITDLSQVTNLSQVANLNQMANLGQLVDISQLVNPTLLANLSQGLPVNVEGMDFDFDFLMENLKKPAEELEIFIESARHGVENLPKILNETIHKYQFHQNQQSLVLVLDTAMSSDKYKGMEKIIKGIVEWSAAKTLSPIYNYIFVGFDYQGFQPPVVTKDPKQFVEAATGPRNMTPKLTPKNMMRALKAALNAAIHHSNIFVVTDAPASDGFDTDNVQKLVEAKQSPITFMLASHTVVDANYDKLAKASNGNVLFLDSDLIIPSVVIDRVDNDRRLIHSVDLKRQETIKLVIDSTISEFTVTLAGLKSKLSLKDPKGNVYSDPPEVKNDNLTIVQVTSPARGQWTISAETVAFLRVTATSPVDFRLGFSTEQPKEFAETFFQPKQGATNVLTLQLVDPTSGITPTHITVEALDGPSKIDLRRIKMSDMYATDAIRLPSWFKVFVNGMDAEGLPVKRLISTAIRPANDFPPIVNVIADEILAVEGQVIELKCTVNSLSAVTIEWKKGDKVLANKESQQSYDLIYRIPRANLTDTGDYTCAASNRLGLQNKRARIGVLPAILMASPETLAVEVQTTITNYVENVDPIIVDCLVNGSASKVFWQFNNQQVNDMFIMANNTLNLGLANRNDSGRYTCTAEGPKKMVSDGIDIVVRYPPTLDGPNKVPISTMVNNTLTLKCESNALPAPNTHWSHKNQTYNNSTPFLDLTHVTFEDEGLYTCTVDNGIPPAAMREFNVVVMAAEAPILTGTKNNMANVGETATLLCGCDTCRPIRTYHWTTPNNQRIEPSAHHRIVTKDLPGVDKFETTLEISDLTSADSGVYRCHVSNDRGETVYSINLKLEGVPFTTVPPTTPSMTPPNETPTHSQATNSTGTTTSTTTTTSAEHQKDTTVPPAPANSAQKLYFGFLWSMAVTFLALKH